MADDILDKKLDKLVRQFKRAHAEFVARYRSARQIINVAASRTVATPAAPPSPVPAPALAGKA